MCVAYEMAAAGVANTIRCFSKSGEGTWFGVTLPIKSEAAYD